MVAGRTDGYALYRFDVVWEFDKLHDFSFEILFDDGFADSVDHFHAIVFLDDSDFILGFEGEVGPEGVVEVQIYLFFLFLHDLNIVDVM